MTASRCGVVFALCVGGLGQVLAADRIYTNTVDVSAGGALATPVQLHQDTFKAWLADADYNRWTNYTPNANVRYDQPLVTELTWGEAGRALSFTNLCPGATYDWQVEKGDGTPLSGSFTTAAEAPRTLLSPVYGYSSSGITFVSNFRDLGGWPLVGSDKRTRFDVFFRSAGWDAYFRGRGDCRAGNPMHSTFGINTEVDLRDDNNITTVVNDGTIDTESYYFTTNVTTGAYDGKCGPDHPFTKAPSLPDGDESVRFFRTRMTSSLPTSGNSTNEIRRTFRVFGQQKYHPVLFHCIGGRDRTGLIAFLVEALCGLSVDDIYRDHLAIVFAAQGAMYAERVDGYLRVLYSTKDGDGNERFAQYGDSLTGRVRAYLEYVGVPAEELAVVTQSLAGETPDEVLARVNAYESAHRYRTLFYKTGTTVNAAYRVGDDNLYREPVLAIADHYSSYKLSRTGYRFVGWSAEQDGVRESQWERIVKHTVTFVDPFGSVLGVTTVETGGDATAAIPAAPPGTTITGWDQSVTDVRSDLTVTCTMTGLAGFEGSRGTRVTEGAVVARGGDEVYRLDTALGTEYVHVFKTASAVRTFKNTALADLNVTYLAVGGGGAGGDSSSNYFGGGGGGGGGVAGATAKISVGETWSVLVGSGGASPGKYQNARIPSEATTISNATAAVAMAPGGGAGESCTTTKDTMTAGANGGGASSRSKYSGATGEFASYCDGVTYPLHKGGNKAKASVGGGSSADALPGGGAGAGANGGNGLADAFQAGHGGLGVYSSITGELQVYGSGGGGGGGVPTNHVFGVTNELGLAQGMHPGRSANGGGRGGYGIGASGLYTKPQSGANGFGGGAGGAQSGRAVSANEITGGSGVVILRYLEPTSATPATGGTVTVIESEMATDYIHTFTSTNGVETFRNQSGAPLYVRYLVVGGGGAGGDTYKTYQSGAGGGGGGVAGAYAQMAAGETWRIVVGAGGTSPGNRYLLRNPAGASSISNGTAEVVLAPGGGGAGSVASASDDHPGRYAQSGAAGGGSARDNGNGAAGTFASYEAGVTYAKNAGGTGTRVKLTDKNGVAYYTNFGGGGGGAGAAGGAGNTTTVTAGAGGDGIASDITGESVYYGGGGGGGVTTNGIYSCYVDNGIDYPQPGPGGKGGGGAGCYLKIKSDGSSSKYAPKAGTDGLGGGGGGGSGCSSTVCMGAAGGSGVVILRYSVLKSAQPTTLRATGNAGEVTYSCSGELVQSGGEVWVMPGSTARLSAVDAGGRELGCWRDDSTGELFWGESVTVTPADFTTYTACFGGAWTYDNIAKTVSNGEWTFKATLSGDKLSLTEATASPTEAGDLNLATSVRDANGTAYEIQTLGNSSSPSGTDGLFGLDKTNAHRLKVTGLYLPPNVKRIGKRAFLSCSNLAGPLCLPETVTLYKYAFSSCSNVTAVVFKGGTAGGQVFDTNGYQFENCVRLAGELDLPDNNTSVPSYCFSHTALTRLSAPNATKVGASAFSACSKLTRVELSDGVISLGDSAFHSCSNLVYLPPSLPMTLTSLGERALYNCRKLTYSKLSLPKLKKIPYQSLYHVEIYSLDLPAVTNVGGTAFLTSHLTNVTFGAERVSFYADHSDYTYGYGSFGRLGSNCSFYFPGKAPLLLPTMNGSEKALIDGHGYTGAPRGTSVSPMFGSNDGFRFYGSWKSDPVGWQKIIDDGVGAALQDVSPSPPAREQLDPRTREVKGVFHALAGSNATKYGWLIDWKPPRGLVILFNGLP